MEKIWKSATQNEYKKCFDILNTQSHIEKETFKNFATTVFEIAKKQLGCPECTLRFINDERNNLGFASVMNRTVTLNLNKMEKQTLFKTISTIYHELTHIYQDKMDEKKKIGTQTPATFPYIHCYSDERFLPADILGIDPFLFYFTCQHEKQARDVGSECAMELFTQLKNLCKIQPTRAGTERYIDRLISQTQTRWDKENANNAGATAQIQAFLKMNPNFVHTAFEKIKQEFIRDASRFGIVSKERLECESRFNRRIGALVLLGCDDNLKSQILNFASSNFINKGEIFNALISVTDSPYSKTTKGDLDLLFKFAEMNNCPTETLLNLLISWDNDYIISVMNGTSFKGSNSTNKKFNNNYEF